ncbi:MAG: hypothetical protein ACRC5T_14120 [Cetobacterium sp.]
MQMLTIEVSKLKNSLNGNPSYKIESWDNQEAFDKLSEEGYFVKLKNSFWKTKNNAMWVYSLSKNNGTIVNGISIMIKKD